MPGAIIVEIVERCQYCSRRPTAEGVGGGLCGHCKRTLCAKCKKGLGCFDIPPRCNPRPDGTGVG